MNRDLALVLFADDETSDIRRYQRSQQERGLLGDTECNESEQDERKDDGGPESDCSYRIVEYGPEIAAFFSRLGQRRWKCTGHGESAYSHLCTYTPI